MDARPRTSVRVDRQVAASALTCLIGNAHTVDFAGAAHLFAAAPVETRPAAIAAIMKEVARMLSSR
jgi:hypothetical protein